MTRVVAAALALSLLQTGASDFEDLARRAEEAVGQNPNQAAILYRQALALRPRWPEGWLYLGATLLQLGQFQESRAALLKGAELEPAKGTPWAYLGMAEYELGDYRQALLHIVKGEAIGLADRPEFVAAVHYRAALAELRFGEYGLALNQLRPLVRGGNNSPPLIQVLGISALFLPVNRPEDIPENKRALVELAGRAAWAYVADRPTEAQPLFEQLVADFGNEPGVHYMYGVFLLNTDASAAEREFRNELAAVPNHVLANVQLALLFNKRTDSAHAAETFAREAVRLQPGCAPCQVTLGRVLFKAGRTNEAIRALERGRSLAPDVARTHFYLQQAYKRAGRLADAKREGAEFSRLRVRQEPAMIGDR